MAEPITDPQNIDPPENQPDEITLESIGETTPEDLSDDQKTFIQEHAEELTDEQKETYKEVIESKKDDTPVNPDDVEPETRTPAQIKKDKKDKKEEDDPDEDEDEVDPEDEEKIGKIVDKRVGGALKEIQTIKDQTDVDAYIRVKPELAPYREVALKYMAHPAYANIPVHNIMAIVASKDLQKIGAQKERDAAKKARDTQNPNNGTVRQPAKGKVDWSKAPQEEFDAQHARALGQQTE